MNNWEKRGKKIERIKGKEEIEEDWGMMRPKKGWGENN